MPDRPYRDMTDEQLEATIRAMPRRQPRAAVRDQILARAARIRAARPARRRVFRLAYSLPALVLLLLLDWLVTSWQGVVLRGAGAWPPASDRLASAANYRSSQAMRTGKRGLALLHPAAPVAGDDAPNRDQVGYWQMRRQALELVDGG